MKWTTTKPSVEGWYWLRRLGSTKAVEIIADGDNPTYWVVVGAELRWSLGGMDGEWLGPITPTDDAALRRAKAEGIRMVETYARAFVHERAVQLDGFTGSSGMAGVIRGKQSEADRIVDWADARAAQIEEGE